MVVFCVHDWGSHMCVNNEIDNDDEWAKGGPYPRNKVDVKAKAKFAKDKFTLTR